MRRGFLRTAVVGALLAASPAGAETLVINREFKDARVIAFELPDDVDKRKALASLKATRDRFFKGAELLDAAKTEEAVLREKLRDKFILYSVFGKTAPLLAAVGRPLDFQSRPSGAALGGRTFSGDGLRLIFVGKNPYSGGRCVVYAAGTNASLAGINSLFHGPRSYHVFDGRTLLQEGDYDDDFTFKAERLSAAEAQEDVAQFFESLQEVHPDLLAKVDADEFLKLKGRIVDEVSRKLDREGTVGVPELAYALYYAGAFFRDGHTSVSWMRNPTANDAAGKRFPPFLLNFRNGGFFIGDAVDKDLRDSELVAVDGTPSRQFLEPILDRCSGETLPFKATRFTGKQAFWWWLSDLWPASKTVKVTLLDRSGATLERALDTVDYDAFDALAGGRSDPHARPAGTRHALLDGGRIAHLVYPSFEFSDAEKTNVDGIFRDIQEKRSRALILDIRGNGGGSSSMGEFILSYLTEKKFRSFSQIQVKISQRLLELDRYADYKKYSSLKGMTITRHSEEERPEKPAAFFPGGIYLLVDNGSFSSAADFAAMFRDYEVGEIIGYETGGLANSFGDVVALSLKNSGMPYGVSYKKFLGPRPKPGDDEHGVLPDVPITAELLAKYKDRPDPVLSFAVDRIKSRLKD